MDPDAAGYKEEQYGETSNHNCASGEITDDGKIFVRCGTKLGLRRVVFVGLEWVSRLKVPPELWSSPRPPPEEARSCCRHSGWAAEERAVASGKRKGSMKTKMTVTMVRHTPNRYPIVNDGQAQSFITNETPCGGRKGVSGRASVERPTLQERSMGTLSGGPWFCGLHFTILDRDTSCSQRKQSRNSFVSLTFFFLSGNCFFVRAFWNLRRAAVHNSTSCVFCINLFLRRKRKSRKKAGDRDLEHDGERHDDKYKVGRASGARRRSRFVDRFVLVVRIGAFLIFVTCGCLFFVFFILTI